MSDTYSIKEIAEDLLDNGSISKEDVKQIKSFINDINKYDVLIEILTLTHELAWIDIDNDIIDLIVFCIKEIFYDKGIITDRTAIELISLFDPENSLNPFERKALMKIKAEGNYSNTLRNFMDDHTL